MTLNAQACIPVEFAVADLTGTEGQLLLDRRIDYLQSQLGPDPNDYHIRSAKRRILHEATEAEKAAGGGSAGASASSSAAAAQNPQPAQPAVAGQKRQCSSS